MKKIASIGILLIILGVTYLFKDDIALFYVENFIKIDKTVVLESKNDYARNYSFDYVQLTNNFTPSNYQDLKNIYYTIINSGKSSFSFYCPKEYKKCISDVKDLANDQTTLSHINNFVHPFNGFKHIETEYDNIGKITIKVDKTYKKDRQVTVTNKIKAIIKSEVDENDTTENKIKTVHDYIINHTKYDSSRSDDKIVNYDSDTAYGALIEGFSLCGGYTDSMALFLEAMGIKNYKIASENHVWNALLLDGKWYHLDLTWDDPVTSDGSDVLEYNFFLITTDELNELETNQHHFDKTVYKEFT